MTFNINKKAGVVLFVYPLFFLISEIVYRYFFDIPKLGRYIETYLIFFIFVLFFYFSKWKITRFFILIFFASSQIVNAVHYEVYQNWINSTNYFLLLKEITEVFNVGVSMLDKVVPVFVYTFIEVIVFSTISLWRSQIISRKRVFLDSLFYVIFIYMFIRSFSSNQEFGLTSNPAYSRIKHNFYTVSHLLGRFLPYEIFNLSDVEEYRLEMPKVIKQPEVKNIILIMGESLTATHVNAFGYPRETMPFLTALSKQDHRVMFKQTYSAGLMTAISVPAFFNAIPRPNGLTQIIKGDTNFFRLAKEQGFNTYFYTSQPEREMMIMSIMGKSWMDHQITPTQLGIEPYKGMNDHRLFPLFQNINLDEGSNFIVLHQRGSHGVYAEYLSPEEKQFKGNTTLDDYDSTIYNTDQLIEKVYRHLQARNKDDYLLIYTSDHGQYVTNEVYNQGTMAESQYIVPAFIYSPQQTVLEQMKPFTQCDRLFHQQIATLIIRVMGFDMPLADCKKGVINSSILSGDLGYLNVEVPNPPAFIKPQRQ